MRVRVFRNLNKGCLSVIAREGKNKGKVIAYAESVYLKNVSFIVSEASRQRVLRERCKNVHAWCEGDIDCCDLIEMRLGEDCLPIGKADHAHDVLVRYNPYLRDCFFVDSDKKKITHAGCAEVKTNGVWIENEN